MSDWGSVVLPSLLAVILVTAPGAAIAAALGLRGVALLGSAGPLSIAVLGGSAVLAAPARIPFGGWVLLGGTAIAVLAALGVRVLLGRLGVPVGTGTADGRAVVSAVAAAVAVATVATGLIGFGGVSSPILPSQTYDGVFHLNAVAWILDNGDASSFHLYRLTHPGDDVEFYPAAWHSVAALVVQLTGISVPAAATATWVATSGAMFAAGGAWLSLMLLPEARNRVLVGVTGALAASVTAAAPYVLLRWGVLYPTGLAYALLPAGLALSVLVIRSLPTRQALLPSLLLAAWLLAEVFAHPRSLVSFALLVAPLLLAAAIGWARRGIVDGERRRRTLTLLIGGTAIAAVLTAAFAVAVLRYFRAGDRPIAERLNGGPATARQTFGESLLQALALTPPSGPMEATLPVTWLVAVAVLAGLVLALLDARTRWIVGAYLLVAVLYAFAAGSNSDLAKVLTGFWYKDKFRLFALLGVLAPPLLALVVTSAERLLARARPSRPLAAAAAPVLLALLVVAAWTGPTLSAMRSAIASDYALAASKEGRLLDSAEFDMLVRLPELTEPDAVIVGNPWNGSTLSWAVGGRESLFPHMTGRWDPDRRIVAERLDRVAEDPDVCAALDRLGARYLLSSEGLLWNGDPQAVFFEAVDRAASAPGFAEIASAGGTRLYRITACV